MAKDGGRLCWNMTRLSLFRSSTATAASTLSSDSADDSMKSRAYGFGLFAAACVAVISTLHGESGAVVLECRCAYCLDFRSDIVKFFI